MFPVLIFFFYLFILIKNHLTLKITQQMHMHYTPNV